MSWAGRDANPLSQPVMDLSPTPIEAPEAELVGDRLTGRVFMGHGPPGEPIPKHVAHGIHEFAAGVGRRDPTRLEPGVRATRIAHSASVRSEG